MAGLLARKRVLSSCSCAMLLMVAMAAVCEANVLVLDSINAKESTSKSQTQTQAASKHDKPSDYYDSSAAEILLQSLEKETATLEQFDPLASKPLTRSFSITDNGMSKTQDKFIRKELLQLYMFKLRMLKMLGPDYFNRVITEDDKTEYFTNYIAKAMKRTLEGHGLRRKVKEDLSRELATQMDYVQQVLVGMIPGMTHTKGPKSIKDLAASITAMAKTVAKPTDWGYGASNGPDSWKIISPEYSLCDAGTHQSPINILERTIGDKTKNVNSATQPITDVLTSDWLPFAAPEMSNDGRKLTITPPLPSTADATQPKGTLLVPGQETPLSLQRVHIKVPSEHQIDSKQYAMELQLWHKGGNDGKQTAVVSILFNQDQTASPFLTKFIPNLPPSGTTSAKLPASVSMDIYQDLSLPKTIGGFYAYNGSLPFPPCTEGVMYYIVKDVKTASAAQTQAIARVLADGTNSRPYQNKKWAPTTYVLEYGGDM
eukprot:GILK01000519.1.p1 GENE.GILK01000519.1~~GILK01000519.1.p1  ORF type:complete len:501 (+),score=92.55 GILK01000519.1:46-1503(+)